jgi:hypothetical protein
MENKLEQKLITVAPILYQQHKWDVTSTAMCWGFECPDTWFDILFELSKNIEIINKILVKYDCAIQAIQVKEKFGYLNFYYDLIFEKLPESDAEKMIINKYRDEVDKLIDAAEIASWNICAFCGKPAEATTIGWITRVCNQCVKERKLNIKDEEV